MYGNSKPGWDIRQETLMTTSKNIRTKEKCWNMLRGTEKSNKTIETTNTTRGNKSESTCKGGRIKIIRDRIKQYKQNTTLLNNEKKFYLHVGEGYMKTYQQQLNKFGAKYGNGEIITAKSNG